MTDPMTTTPVAERTIPAAFGRSLAAGPDALALVDGDGASFSYRAADVAAREIATGLAGLGVGRQEPVLVMLDNHADNALVWLGLTLSAMVHVPINTAYKGEMLGYIAAHSQARVAVVEAAYLPRIAAIAAGAPELATVVIRGQVDGEPPAGLRVIDFDTLGTAPAPALAAAPASPVEPPAVSDVSTILYTSGTTGPSKGVLYAHGAAFATSIYPELEPGSATLVTMPLFHGTGLFAGVLNALRSGATAVIQRSFSASGFWDQVRRYGCSTTVLMGGTAEFLWRQPASERDTDHPLTSVGILPSPPNVADWSRRFGVRVSTAYGLTEVGVCTTTGPGEALPFHCGFPRPFLEVRVVDEMDVDVKPGEIGELIVRSREPWATMLGYHRMPDETVALWRNLWLHTGDAMYQDESGQLVFVDRIKDALRRRGENVSSFEVEGHIMKRDDVAAAAVVAVPSEYAEQELKAVLVLADRAAFDPHAVLRDLYERMPYFMVPRYYEVIDELPSTPTHKVRKTELRAQGLTANTWDCEAHGYRITRDALITPERAPA